MSLNVLFFFKLNAADIIVIFSFLNWEFFTKNAKLGKFVPRFHLERSQIQLLMSP